MVDAKRNFRDRVPFPDREQLRERMQRARERFSQDDDPTVARPPRYQEIHQIARSKNAPEIEIPWNIRVAAAWSWRSLLILASMVALGFLIIQLRAIAIPFLIAVFITVALDPLARLLRVRVRLPKPLAAVITVLVFVTALVLLVMFAGRSLITGFSNLSEQAQAGLQALLDWLANGPLHINQEQIDSVMEEAQKVIQNNAGGLASGALSITTSIGNIGAGLFLSLFMVIFFLMDGRKIWVWFLRLLPHNWRVNTHEASIRGFVTLRGYVKSQVLVALIDAVGIAGGALFLGVELWFPIGVVVFLFSFIPIVGALFSGTVACLVALVDKGMTAAVILLIIVLLVQQIEANVLQPFIMGSHVSLHPVAVLLGVAAGTYIAGVTGAVFAVPIMAFTNTFMLYLSGHDTFPRLATDPDRPGGPPGTLKEQILESYGYEPGTDIRNHLDDYVFETDAEKRAAYQAAFDFDALDDDDLVDAALQGLAEDVDDEDPGRPTDHILDTPDDGGAADTGSDRHASS